MRTQDLGWDPTGLMTFRTTLPAARYADAAAVNAFHDALLERLRGLPGVTSAGAIHSLPLRGSNSVNTFSRPGGSEADAWPARLSWVSAGYLETMGIEVVSGRAIEATDDAAAQPVVLINELIARHRFEGEDAIGGSIVVDGEAYTVIGVIENTHDRAMSRPPEPSLYFPAAQALVRTNAFVVRSGREAETLVPDLRRAVAELDVDQPLYEVQPISALIDQDMGPYLLIAGMMFSFALVSLLLGAVGIYGVTAYAVGRRTQEIGLRMAIGAERRGVMTMIVGEGMRRALLGVAIGLVLAYPLSRALRAIAVGVNPSDPLTFIMVAATLLLVAFLGTWLPAMRVARLDPVRALSAE